MEVKTILEEAFEVRGVDLDGKPFDKGAPAVLFLLCNGVFFFFLCNSVAHQGPNRDLRH